MNPQMSANRMLNVEKVIVKDKHGYNNQCLVDVCCEHTVRRKKIFWESAFIQRGNWRGKNFVDFDKAMNLYPLKNKAVYKVFQVSWGWTG